MGMYTALHFNADIWQAPDLVVDTLKSMTGQGPLPVQLPRHPLFAPDNRWEYMLQCDSYYFQADTHSIVYPFPSKGYGISITCNFKNYNNEIDLFLDWIMPYVEAEPGKWLGYHMYENDDVPTLIFYPGKDEGTK